MDKIPTLHIPPTRAVRRNNQTMLRVGVGLLLLSLLIVGYFLRGVAM